MVIKLIHQHFDRRDYDSHSEFRSDIATHLKIILVGKSVINDDTGLSIAFNKAGIEKMVSKIGGIKSFALCNLQPILKNATFVEQQHDKKNRTFILSVLLFKVMVEIKDSEYEVWCYVRHQNDGHFLYSLNINAQKNALG
ncbi:hypothetical protein [Mucilaginibacter sp.]|uniref:LPD3 domain-containing protein n=1 Tax=Mucilaginibacter sp. TaxID=1882438 RepID=UPI002631A60F|nr:hypothetical protein [Mucilaginibacter sp.]MDB5127684.1 Large polyvalent protein-associated domain 3 [Mucilaginibacter sp.]